MRAVLTAVIAAFEAIAIALAVFIMIGLPAGAIWWLVFDLELEPNALLSLITSAWQLAHFVPQTVTIAAQDALNLGLAANDLSFVLSLAPLGLTLTTVVLAFRAGMRAANAGGMGAWALVGGVTGFGVAAYLAQTITHGVDAGISVNANDTVISKILFPCLVFAVGSTAGFLWRSYRSNQAWILRCIEWLQPRVPAAVWLNTSPTLQLAAASIIALVGLSALAFAISLFIGYIEYMRIAQGLQLDIIGMLLMFLFQISLLPVAIIWGMSWFAGNGFAIGIATSVSPFETLLGPLPALPMLGAIPQGWGWLGAFAPVIVIGVAVAIGGYAAGKDPLRNARSSVLFAVPCTAALIAGMAVVLLQFTATGAIGPERLAFAGAQPWATGGLIAAELAFGLSLGMFARRVDVENLRGKGALTPEDYTQVPEVARAETNRLEPEMQVESDPLLRAFSWESRNEKGD